MAENSRDHPPLSDVVLCSTSLAQDARTRLAELAETLGATHKLDLTGEVTHLIVGDINTPKYKYVAQERPDIIVLHPSWIDAIRAAWITGNEIDIQDLERSHRCPTFAGLKICITGVPDQAQRTHLSNTIEHEGAEYHGDLTKQVTHLLVASPEGAKYRAAQDWRISTVSMKWLEDSVRRGMALDPKYYDPTMSYEEQGKGAYRKDVGPRTTLGKRLRNEESQTTTVSGASKRKLKRHASRRLEDHSQDMWQDISAIDESIVAPLEAKTNQWTAGDEDSQLTVGRAAAQPLVEKSFDLRQEHTAIIAPRPEGLFSGWCIAMHGFEIEKMKRLAQYLEPNGAHVAKRLEDLETIGDEYEKRCILVPHAQSEENAHLPQSSSGTVIATEWWVERCIHYKQILDPEQDVLSQPLWNLNILGFSKLTISTTGFSGVDYRQVAESIKLAGATYQENLTPAISVLVSGTVTVKKEKAYYAAKHSIPVANAEWLWTCLKSKRKTSMDRFRIELPKYDPNNATGQASAAPSPVPSDAMKRSGSTGPKKDNQVISRLSHTRKRQTTPSLPLQAHKPSAKISKPTGPFVHEDDDDDDDDEGDDYVKNDLGMTVDGENDVTTDQLSVKAAPLRAISSNASSRKRPSVDEQKEDPPGEDEAASKDTHTNEPTDTNVNNAKATSPPVDEPPAPLPATRPQADWTADLASLMEKQQRRTALSDHHTPAQRLKYRKLGRAASGGNLTNRTNSASTTLNQEAQHGDLSFSGSPDSLSAPQAELPSTQIGYETLEAEAARMQMAKRMGTSYSDESTGTRMASVGTVRDSAAAASAPGRARNRQRK